MAFLLDQLLVFLGLKYRRPETRLSEEEAIEIAAAYADSEGFQQFHLPLYPSDVRVIEGRLVWLMRSPTKGRWMIVSIDDATGEVLGHKVHGVR